MTETLRLLAVDDEYLVALDVNMVLSEFDCVEVTTTTSDQVFDLELEGFDVILVDPNSKHIDNGDLERLADHAGLVFGIYEPFEPGQVPDGAAPVLVKPYSAPPLMNAIADVVGPRQPSLARAVMDAVSGSGP